MSTGFFLMNAHSGSWLEALWRAFWQGGLALFLVWVVCRAFRRLPARAKSWLWRLAYLKLLVAFLWSAPIDLPLLRARPVSRPVSIPTLEAGMKPVLPNPVTRNEPQQRPSPPVRSQPLPNTASWLLVLWGLGVSWFGLCTLGDLRRARLLRRGCQPVTDERLNQCSGQLAQYFRLRYSPTLTVTDAASSPLLLGIARPVIVLPSSVVSGVGLEDLRLMVAHEMAHIKRSDLWWIWLAVAGESLFFFHPLVWLAKREWRLTQEMACDEMVVQMTKIPASRYGDMLVGVTALIRPNCREPILITLGLNESRETLKRRLRAMKFIKEHSTTRMAIAAGAILVVGGVSLLPWRLVAQETRSTGEPATQFATNASPTSVSGRTRVAGQQNDESTATPAVTAGQTEGATRPGRRSTGFMSPSRAGMSSRGSIAAPRPPTDVAPFRFEATIYEVQVPQNRIADLDAQALEARAATPQNLAKALAEFGDTKVLYKIDQAVNLYGENITLGTSEPMVTGSSMARPGQPINSITYQQVGLIVNISASALPKDSQREGLGVQVNFQLSALADSGVEISPSVKASSVRNVQLSQSGMPRFGRPAVLLNVSAPSGGDKPQPVAYVVRYVFNETKP